MPAPYEIIADGDELFGIGGETFQGFIVESYSITTPSNRVDLDDGNGEPLGSTIVPQRQEVSLTVQLGATATAPTLGGPTTYAGNSILITSVDLTETQADYRRYSLSGYVKIN